MNIEQLMLCLAQAGTTAILKIDNERFEEHGEPWTFVVSGPVLGEGGFVRAEEVTLDECLKVGLSRLMDRGEQWNWVSEYVPN